MLYENEKLIRLQTMILCDTIPNQTINAYLTAETKDNQESVFKKAAQYLRIHLNCFLTITNGQTNGYPGAKVWLNKLTKKYKIESKRITIIPLNKQLNTYTEMEALVKYIKENGWKKILLISTPFHQLRSFLTLLGAMHRLGMRAKELSIYNLPGVTLPWHQHALHSQGIVYGTREELIKAELKRIKIYTAKGDIATVDQALKYLRHRDSD